MKTSLAKKLLFACTATIVTLGAIEVAARAFEGQAGANPAAGTAMVPHPTRIWALEPGRQRSFGVDFSIGPSGLRESQPTALDAKGRILTLGDSSVFGHGVPDGSTLHDQLALRLEERGMPAEVICGGVPGYSTAQSLVLMEEIGWNLEPDVLVVANQFSDMNRDHFRDADVLAQLASPATTVDGVLRRSAVFRGLRSLIAAQKGVPEFAAVGWPSPSSSGEIRVPPEAYVANLSTLLSTAHERGVGVVFLELDERDQIPGGDNRHYAKMMESVGTAWGVPVVRAAALFEQSGFAREKLFLDEVHPTGLANGVMAEALAETLVRAKFPKRVPVPLEAPRSEVELLDYHGPSELSAQQQVFLGRPE